MYLIGFILEGIKAKVITMRVMKVYCPVCGEQATIRKIQMEGIDNIPHIYCSCNDFECGHTYMLTLTFSHTIQPSNLKPASNQPILPL
ncbi:ogr/Delta-like zinc finger family protein [Providencia rettgeri]|uniref:ogr/Delta-like zinc finger family protein n=3 Tax=Morganellaceae TaxID=1903414 RepID=UPI00300E1D51